MAFHRDDRGASAVEYGLLIAGIAAIIAIAVFALGQTSGEKLGTDCDTIGNAIASSLKQTNGPGCP